ncbi:MAG: PAS domain S-box protein [Chloroflexi bacterium]|nr:PAS domain S-box protein [Chloroflexota bacterium]
MNRQDKTKAQVICELIDCQQRINEIEKLGNRDSEESRKAREVFESLFELSPDALVVVDRLGHIVRINTQAERLFGYSREELIGQDHGILVPERLRKEHETSLKAYMKQPRVRVMGIGLDLWARRKDGTEFAADIDLGPLKIDRKLFVLSMVRDATRRKQLEDKLLGSERNYRELADLFPEIIFEADIKGIVTYANQKTLDLFGISPAALSQGVNIFDYIAPRDRSIARQRFAKVLQEGDIGADEYVLLKKNGTTFPALVHSTSITREGKTIGIRGIAVDITERKRAEQKLRESEKRLRATLDGMLEGCQIIGFDWRYLYVNNAVARQGRRTKRALLGHTMMEMYPGIENTEMFARLRDCMEKRVSHRMENEFTFPDGSKGWFQLSIQPVPEGVFILSLDISERKKLDEELSSYRQRLEEIVAQRTAEFTRANEKLAQEIAEHSKTEEGLLLRVSILDNTREAILLINPRGDFVYANEAACKTYGYSHDDFLNMNLSQLLRPQDASVIPGRLKEVLKTGQMDLETIHVRKNKSLMPVQVSYSLIKTLHGQFIVSVMRDMTSESGQRLLLEQMPGILWTTDTKLRLTSVMGSGLKAIGLEGQAIGMKLAEYLEKSGFGKKVLSAHRRALAGAADSFQSRNSKLGTTYYGCVSPLHDSQGELIGTVSVAQDATSLIKGE